MKREHTIVVVWYVYREVLVRILVTCRDAAVSSYAVLTPHSSR